MTKEERNSLVITRKRVRVIVVALILFLSLLITNLFKLTTALSSYYKDKVYDQITTSSAMRAERGKIYDANMNVLATTNTVWRVFISTRDIKKAEKERKHPYGEIIASGLSEILSVDKSSLLRKIKNTNVLDVTVKKSASADEYEKVIDFIRKNELESVVFTEAQTSRFYPEGTLLAHVLGFTGSDNQGLYGLEYYYDEYLSGKDGYYLYSKDANGNALTTEYATYVPPEDGYSIVTTIDTYVQSILESQLADAVQKYMTTSRATGIVMDVQTGAILAMATSSPFNPNSPYTLDSISQKKLAESGYPIDSEEYKKYKRELLEVMWSNKAVSETYEPGSTFKIVTVSAAIDGGAAAMSDTFSCVGFHKVGGWTIRCHKITGHGSGFSLSYGLQMSCNPTMMKIAERLGAQAFYSYVKSFGYLEKSGIDLPSEASTIFHKPDAIGATELATASFGQRFKVSVINHLTAIAAVANGGELLTPYVVEKIVDSNGNDIYVHEKQVRRRVIRRDVATAVSMALEEGVSGNGGAKNAAVNGYKIAAKTGTSQKFDVLDENGNSYLRTASTVAYNISESGGIAVIIIVDEPQSAVKYGSVVAAPYVSEFLEVALPYLNYRSNASITEISVPNLVGMSVKSAKAELDTLGVKYEIIGDGEFVLSHTPSDACIIDNKNTTIIIYTVTDNNNVTVPSLVGMELSEAAKLCMDIGLNVRIKGSDIGKVVTQSLPMGANVESGTVIELYSLKTDFED